MKSKFGIRHPHIGKIICIYEDDAKNRLWFIKCRVLLADSSKKKVIKRREYDCFFIL